MCGCKTNNELRSVSKKQPKKFVKHQEKVVYTAKTKIKTNTKYKYVQLYK